MGMSNIRIKALVAEARRLFRPVPESEWFPTPGTGPIARAINKRISDFCVRLQEARLPASERVIDAECKLVATIEREPGMDWNPTRQWSTVDELFEVAEKQQQGPRR